MEVFFPSCLHVQIASLRRRRWWGGRREVREVWWPERTRERWVEERGRRRSGRGIEREVGWGERVRRWRRVRAGRGEVHGSWWVCVSGWSVCLSECWVFSPRVLMPEWRSCMSWWETPVVITLLLLQGVLGNVVRIVWRGKKYRKQSEKISDMVNESHILLECV